ncbi:hypothetical protein DACRYDRAFT_82924 [Dacryopinax primogenitus]|uniref:Uncharacterized protein n=1 Tax=Dacryopinax primogenitus (strain DJM 731) TaxID=1858805 RepID=M5FZN0_DACPD|nr:uncharacterized protein DACRYDRAFT_82924 [Dacryopinax primogenitus]EJT99021.1 hypothetical protein DACRYDRAFT_82924 [Dacryopinax primogenitus]
MPSLALTIFLLVLFTQIISWVGQSVLEDCVFALYIRLISPEPSKRQAQLRKEVFADKQDLLRTSAQDEFAKWAKLRRKVDKGLSELEKLNAAISSQKSAFSLRFKVILWLLTSAAPYILTFYYRREAVFYLPPGLLGPLEWWMSFPWAPKGSVSCAMWQFACRRAVKTAAGLGRELFVVVTQRTAGMAMPGSGKIPVPAAAGPKPEGKEKTQ